MRIKGNDKKQSVICFNDEAFCYILYSNLNIAFKVSWIRPHFYISVYKQQVIGTELQYLHNYPMYEAKIEIFSNTQMKWSQVVLFRKKMGKKRKLSDRWIWLYELKQKVNYW